MPAYIYTHIHTYITAHTHTRQALLSHADLAGVAARRGFTLPVTHLGKDVIGFDKQRTTVMLVIERFARSTLSNGSSASSSNVPGELLASRTAALLHADRALDVGILGGHVHGKDKHVHAPRDHYQVCFAQLDILMRYA